MHYLLDNRPGRRRLLMAGHAAAQITLYEHEGFAGPLVHHPTPVSNFERRFQRSGLVGGRAHDRWEVCEHARFEGRCMVLRPGQYPSLSAMGLNDRISSVRRHHPRLTSVKAAMPRLRTPSTIPAAATTSGSTRPM